MMKNKRITIEISAEEHKFIHDLARTNGIFPKFLYSAIVRKEVENLRQKEKTISDYITF